jgi:glycosyltransferase involved in cell wall biosynthesis
VSPPIAPPLKVCHLALGLGAGGLEQVVASIARRSDRAGFRHRIVVLHVCDVDFVRGLEADGIDVALLRMGSLGQPARLKELRRLAARLEPDVIHAHSGTFMDAYAMKLLAPKSPRLLLTSHGHPLDSGWREIVRDGLPTLRAHAHTCVSDDLRDFFRRRLRPLPVEQKVVTVLNGVDTELFRPRPKPGVLSGVSAQELEDLRESFVIGSVGRLEPVKNHRLLLEAFATLIERTDRPCRLVLVGDGSLRLQLERVARELGLGGSVYFWGVREDIPEVLNLFDAIALTSLTEGTSISLLEAQASGLPAFVTDVGGNRRIVVDGRTGYLFPLGKPLALADHLVKVVENSELHAEMTRNARDNVLASFDLDEMIGKYEALYRGEKP